jgi:Skp family chaperone for outer membrane proteins
MKTIRLITSAIILCAACVCAARAQQPTAPASVRPAADTKIAIINSSVFADENQGIKRIVEAVRRVNNEFQPRSTELQQLRARYDQLAKEINDTKAVADQAALQRKADDAEQLKRDIERKSEDAKAAYDKRLREVIGPVQEEVFKALDAYAKENGISLIIDASQVPILVAAQSVDITQHFISLYNQRNPATGSAGASAPTTAAPTAARPGTTGAGAPRRP